MDVRFYEGGGLFSQGAAGAIDLIEGDAARTHNHHER